MSNWEEIKNQISELDGVSKKSPTDGSLLNNELIMCLFINKINLKYRFKPYYEPPFIDYCNRFFNNTVDENVFIKAYNDKMIKKYIESIIDVLKTKILIAYKNSTEKSIKSSSSTSTKTILSGPTTIPSSSSSILDGIDLLNVDYLLIYCSALENLDLNKYKKLSKMLYEIDTEYLDFAKESIINSNKELSLDKIMFGIDIPEKFENFENIENSFINITNINYTLLIIIIILIIKVINIYYINI